MRWGLYIVPKGGVWGYKYENRIYTYIYNMLHYIHNVAIFGEKNKISNKSKLFSKNVW